MGLLDVLFSKPSLHCKSSKFIDFNKIVALIRSVVENLNDYMENETAIILDPSREKNLRLLDDPDISAVYFWTLGCYYLSLLESYCKGERIADQFLGYLYERFPLMTEKIRASFDQESLRQRKKDYKKMTEITIDLTRTTLNKLIADNRRQYDLDTMPTVLAKYVLNHYYNQKCSDFNVALFTESFKEVLSICCEG